MPSIKTPVVKRPAFWTFLGAAVAFGSVYFLQGVVDPVLLIKLLQALIALIGVSALARTAYVKYLENRE